MRYAANDNGNNTSSNSWQYQEVLGFDPALTLRSVTRNDLTNILFVQDACNVVTDIIKDIPHRIAFEYFLTTWANWNGIFVKADGREEMFDETVIDAVPFEWIRDNFTKRKPTDPPIRIRQENRERLIILFSLAKILRPVDIALCGIRPVNDNG